MYTIINVMLFSFSRFERVSNAERTEQSNSTYHFAFEFVYKCCFFVWVMQLLIVLCFCCKFCVSNKIIVYKHLFLFPIYRDMIRYLII